MHDHGHLPSPKEGGEYAHLIGFVCGAKKASDDFLTKVIEAERMSAPNQHDDSKDNNKTKEGGRKR